MSKIGDRTRHLYHSSMSKVHSALANRATSKESFVHHSGFAKYHDVMKNPRHNPFQSQEDASHKKYVEHHGIKSKGPEEPHKLGTSNVEKRVKELASGAMTENQAIALPTAGGEGTKAL